MFTAEIDKIIGMAVNQGASVQQYISDVLDDTTFRHLGIVPGDPLAPDFAKKQCTQFVLKPPVEAGLLIHEQSFALSKIWAGKTYWVVFTDGSVKMQRHSWLAHGGWGIYAGPKPTTGGTWRVSRSIAIGHNSWLSWKPAVELLHQPELFATTKRLPSRLLTW